MLISDEPVRRRIPHEAGQWMDLKRLSSAALRRARAEAEAQQRKEAAQMMKNLGPEFFQAIRDGDQERRDQIVRQLEDLQYHISNFDIPTLLKEGIVAWSYGTDTATDDDVAESLVPDDPSEVLDERTAVWAAQEIIDLTRPPTEEEEEGNS